VTCFKILGPLHISGTVECRNFTRDTIETCINRSKFVIVKVIMSISVTYNWLVWHCHVLYFHALHLRPLMSCPAFSNFVVFVVFAFSCLACSSPFTQLPSSLPREILSADVVKLVSDEDTCCYFNLLDL